jgi:hypothetical protein
MPAGQSVRPGGSRTAPPSMGLVARSRPTRRDTRPDTHVTGSLPATRPPQRPTALGGEPAGVPVLPASHPARVRDLPPTGWNTDRVGRTDRRARWHPVAYTSELVAVTGPGGADVVRGCRLVGVVALQGVPVGRGPRRTSRGIHGEMVPRMLVIWIVRGLVGSRSRPCRERCRRPGRVGGSR